jgi:hypothetical protein
MIDPWYGDGMRRIRTEPVFLRIAPESRSMARRKDRHRENGPDAHASGRGRPSSVSPAYPPRKLADISEPLLTEREEFQNQVLELAGLNEHLLAKCEELRKEILELQQGDERAARAERKVRGLELLARMAEDYPDPARSATPPQRPSGRRERTSRRWTAVSLAEKWSVSSHRSKNPPCVRPYQLGQATCRRAAAAWRGRSSVQRDRPARAPEASRCTST